MCQMAAPGVGGSTWAFGTNWLVGAAVVSVAIGRGQCFCPMWVLRVMKGQLLRRSGRMARSHTAGFADRQVGKWAELGLEELSAPPASRAPPARHLDSAFTRACREPGVGNLPN